MTPKKAREILESEESVSIEEIAEARSVLRKKMEKNKPKDPRNSLRAHQAWRRRNKEITDLKNEIRKYWGESS